MGASFSFRNKTVLLTGASRGLGSALAVRLAERGARLALSARSASALNELIATLPAPERAVPIAADLASPGEAARLAREAEAALGHVDVLVNNAGLGYFALVEEVGEEKLRQLFEVNTFSPLLLAQALAPGMRRRGGGRIVNVVSCAGRVPIPTVGVYAGSKSALAIMANIMRLELEPDGVVVVNVYPGTIDTGFEDHAAREKGRAGLCPGGGCGRPVDEVADAVVQAAAGAGGEAWLEDQGRRMAAAAVLTPEKVDQTFRPLRDKALREGRAVKPAEERRWRLWQLETSFACNLQCVMCPWKAIRAGLPDDGHMPESVWSALRPHLGDVAAIDFSGGGEPLLQPKLVDWVAEAKGAGCEVGLLTNGLGLDEDMASKLLAAGVDWLAFSIDGADKATYEAIRTGADFDRLTANVRGLTDMRVGKRPKVMVNFVMMPANAHQLQDIVRVAAELGVDQVNFKQCDVVRGEEGRGFGLFASKEEKQIRRYEKDLRRACKLAAKLGVETTAFSFRPEELPVCDQDPRTNLFVRYDGRVAPCINLAIGGPTTFMGQDVTMPDAHYGRLPDDDLPDLWASDACRRYRDRFAERARSHDQALSRQDIEPSLVKLQEAFEAARRAMPPAPDGCRVCHYLYGI